MPGETRYYKKDFVMFPILERTNNISIFEFFFNYFNGFNLFDYLIFGAKYAIGLFILIGAGHLKSKYGGKGWREESDE